MKEESTVEIKKPALIVITHRSIMGALASCAVQQSPYHRPENLEVVLDNFHKQIIVLASFLFCCVLVH
jgi:hypothetical protein